MPEGDTIFRAAAQLRPVLEGRTVTAATASRPGPRIEMVVGSSVEAVVTRGKHLNLRFSNGLELHTHMRMNGQWQVYAPAERWRRPAWQARVALSTEAGQAVCFNAPVVELFPARVAAQQVALAGLGPDLLADDFNPGEALRRLRDPTRAGLELGESLLDQRAMAGLGNVYKSETLFLEQLDPFAGVAALDDDRWLRLIERGRALLHDNRLRGRRITTSAVAAASGVRLWVYGRGGQPCWRCGSTVRSRLQGHDLPRRTFWCPRCQPPL